jgi:lipooligosaccharide transport system permease protein
MRVSARHAFAVWRRNATMYRRTWTWNRLPNFFEPVLYLVSIGVGVGAYISKMRGMSYIQFISPGLVCVAAMNGASFEVTYNIFVRMNYEKAYDAMLTTPLQPADIFAGEVLWAMTRSVIYGFCFYAVLLVAGLAPLPSSLWVLPVVPVTGLLFSAVGLAFTLRIRVIEFFSFYFTLFLTPLFLFSSVFFPLEERMPSGVLWVAEILPLLHPVRLARTAFRGEMSALVWWDIAYIVFVTVALLLSGTRRIHQRLTQ